MLIQVHTTQNVTIDYAPAGLGYRLLAYLIDWLVIIAWGIGWWALVFLIGGLSYTVADDSPLFWLIFGTIFLIPIIFYDLIFETMNNGQTPGKMLFKIKVVNVDGTAPSLSGYLLRWLFRVVDCTISEGLLAIIMIIATDKSQRMGDYLAGTTVIDLHVKSKDKRLSIPDFRFKDNYQPMFPDILDRLSDRDLQTVVSILDDYKMNTNEYFMKRLADRVKTVTGYTFNGPDGIFLQKIVEDYNYLAIQ